ncbi:MAG: DUF427 domain-containing protein [Nakamurella sp.]
MNGYPSMIAAVHHMEPVPRRIRARLDDQFVLDTTHAKYVWEWPNYPQYYIPLADVTPGLLVDDGRAGSSRSGPVQQKGIRAAGGIRPRSARVYGAGSAEGLAGLVRFDWAAMDAWFEEDEEVFVHPRNPYTRVDAIRSTRRVRISLEGVLLAETVSSVMVFETGLPTRYYLNRSEINFEHLEPSLTRTSCPYKGRTSGYWSIRIGDISYPDLAWAYDFPTRQLLPIAGMLAFYNEKVDVTLDGQQQDRPITHFFK